MILLEAQTKFEWLGYIGSFLFAICGAPQAIKSFREKNSEGISWWLLILWISGELITLVYTSINLYWPLIFNYVFNIIFISVILFYKIKGTKK